VIASLRFFARLSAGHLRRHRLEALLCLIGVALGVAVVVGIESAVAACVGSFRGAVQTLAERSTHSIVSTTPGGIGDDVYIRLANSPPPCPIAPVIERSLLVAPVNRPDAKPIVARLIGVDVFSEKQLRSFTNMRGNLGEDAYRQFMTQPGSVALVDDLAGRLGASPGSKLQLTIGQRRVGVTVVAVVKPEGVARSQLGDVIIADLATAQERAESIGRIDRIDVRIESDEQQTALAALLPPGLTLRGTSQQSSSLADLVASYKLNLNSLSMMAAFVAIFIVYNSMLVSVRQRSTTLGILSCLGASRGQIAALYLLEAGLFAIIGGALGLAGGWALSRVLIGYIATTINDLYAAVRPAPVSLDGVMILKGLAVSFVSCLAGALVPLIQASRTPPINSTRQSAGSGQASRAAGRLAIAGLIFLVLSLLVYKLPGNSPIAGFVMALLVGLGFASLCPLLTRLICAMVGMIARRRQSLPMQMAAAGVSRSLGITGVAVAAMMLASAMTVSIRTMVDSFRGALGSWMERRFAADVFVGPELMVNHKIESTIDPAAEAWVRSRPEVKSVVRYRVINSEIGGKTALVVGTDLAPLLANKTFPLKSGDVTGMNFATEVLISEPLAGRLHLKPGDTLEMPTPAGLRRYTARAVFFDFGSERGQVIFDRPAFMEAFNDPTVTSLHVHLNSGFDPTTVASDWAQELRRDYPVVVNSFAHVKTEVLAVFDRTFAVTAILAWLAGGVAFCGLAGSLLALALARQRDYAVLAAVGMSRSQTATWVIGQGLLIAWTSALMASIAGTALAYVLSYVIQYRSFGWSIPTSPQPRFWLEAFVLATGAALFASVYPIYRLTRTAPAVNLRQE